MACVDYQSYHVGSIPDRRTPQYHVIVFQAILFVIETVNMSITIGDIFIRLVTDQQHLVIVEHPILKHHLDLAIYSARFEQTFSIQVFGFYEHFLRRVGRIDDQHIGRRLLVALDFDDISYIDILPLGLHELAIFVDQYIVHVFQPVHFYFLVVFQVLFKHRQRDHDEQSEQ